MIRYYSPSDAVLFWAFFLEEEGGGVVGRRARPPYPNTVQLSTDSRRKALRFPNQITTYVKFDDASNG